MSALRLFGIDPAVRPAATSCTGECQKSGPLGLLVILLLCIACYFLFKSLSRHLRNVRDHFPEELPPDPSLAKRPIATTLPALAADGDGDAATANAANLAGAAGSPDGGPDEPVQVQPGATPPDARSD